MLDNELKQIEKMAYKAFFKDGIWDITLGLLVISLSLAPILENLGIIRPLNILIVFLPAILFTFLGKRNITLPRLGLVKFGEKRKSDKKKKLVISSVFILSTAGILFLLKSGIFPGGLSLVNGELSNLMVISVLLVGLPLCFIAYYLDFIRLYIYTVLITISIPAVEILSNTVRSPFEGLIIFGIAGGIPFITGLVLLLNFLNKNPIPEETQYRKENMG